MGTVVMYTQIAMDDRGDHYIVNWSDTNCLRLNKGDEAKNE